MLENDIEIGFQRIFHHEKYTDFQDFYSKNAPIKCSITSFGDPNALSITGWLRYNTFHILRYDKQMTKSVRFLDDFC